MQIAQMVHSIIAVLFVALILGHIYIGTLGMEGAFEAMAIGEVDFNWAKEHHDLWLKEASEISVRRRPCGASISNVGRIDAMPRMGHRHPPGDCSHGSQ